MPLVDLPRGARVLVVMMSAAGDAVHVLPVLNALKRHDPTLHLTWILQPGPAALVGDPPAADRVVRFDPRGGLRAFRALRRELAGPPFDLLLALQVYFKASLATLLAPARVKLGFDRARARDGNWLVTSRRIPPHPVQHVQDQYFEFLRALGVDPEPLEWGLGPRPEEREAQRAFFAGLDRPAAALVVGSTHLEKEWVPARWAALADALYEREGLQPVLVGGRSPREVETEREILARARVPVVSTLGDPFRAMVGVLDGAALVVTLDTGPMHAAVALGVPTLSLIGYYDPKRTGPYRRFHDLLVDAYHDPGEEAPPSARKRPGRTGTITVDQVLERVERWRERYAGARLDALCAAGLLGPR